MALREVPSFAILDTVVIALFIVLLLALGFSVRLRENSVIQFIAAGRNLTLPAFVATLVSTWYGGILGVSETVSFYGVGAWLLIGVPYYLFAFVYASWFAPRVRAAEQISIPERLALRWGKSVGAAAGILVFLLAVPAAHALMLGTLLSVMTGWELLPAVAIATIGASLFLYKGGLLADVRVSFLAFLAMYVGFAVMLAWCIAHYPVGEMWTKLAPTSKDFSGGGGPLLVLGFFLLGAWTLVDPGFHQRVASASNPAVGKRGIFVSIVCWMVFDLLSIGTALYGLALMPGVGGKELFPAMGSSILPAGLWGLFFCGMLGTILSACVSYTLVAGASFGRDVVSRLKGIQEDRLITNWTRAGMAAATLLAIPLAVSIPSVINLWYAWGGAIIGALLIPVCIAYIGSSTRVTPKWMAASMALGFLGSGLWLAWSLTHGNEFQEIAFVKSSEGWAMTVPPLREGLEAVRFSLGTLVPALVISAAVLALSAVSGGRTRDDR